MTDHAHELDALLDAPKAEAFVAERAGDRIDGVVVSPIREWEGEYGLYPIVVIRTTKMVANGVEQDAGEVRSLHGLGTLLADKLRMEDPQRGDTIAARFNGLITSPRTGREYKDWSVAVIRGDGPPPLRPTPPMAQRPAEPEEEPF